MSEYCFVVATSFPMENVLPRAPQINFLPLNMVESLNLSPDFTKGTQGSGKNLDSTAFVVEGQAAPDWESSYFEEPDSNGPFLREITNSSQTSDVWPTKIDKLNNIDEPSLAETEEMRGAQLDRFIGILRTS